MTPKVQFIAALAAAYRDPSTPISSPTVPSQETTEIVEARLYRQIAQELEANIVDKGLWTMAYAQARGYDKQTRALYIKTRFTRLHAGGVIRMNQHKMCPAICVGSMRRGSGGRESSW